MQDREGLKPNSLVIYFGTFSETLNKRVKLVLRAPYFLHLSRYRVHYALADIRRPVSSAFEVVGDPDEAGGTVRCLGVKISSTFLNLTRFYEKGFSASLLHRAAFLLNGDLIEGRIAHQIFTKSRNKKTEDYVTGQFG